MRNYDSLSWIWLAFWNRVLYRQVSNYTLKLDSKNKKRWLSRWMQWIAWACCCGAELRITCWTFGASEVWRLTVVRRANCEAHLSTTCEAEKLFSFFRTLSCGWGQAAKSRLYAYAARVQFTTLRRVFREYSLFCSSEVCWKKNLLLRTVTLAPSMTRHDRIPFSQ